MGSKTIPGRDSRPCGRVRLHGRCHGGGKAEGHQPAGDLRRHVEPNWEERLTVHRRSQKSRPVRQHGEGAPGRRRLRGPPRRRHGPRPARHLSPAQRRLPPVAGPPPRQRRGTVLIKEPSQTTKLAADSDWFDQEITLADASGFQRRRRRLPARAQPAQRRQQRSSSARWWPAPATASSSTAPCARTSGCMGEPPSPRCSPSSAARTSPTWRSRTSRSTATRRTTTTSTATTPAAFSCRTATGSPSAR